MWLATVFQHSPNLSCPSTALMGKRVATSDGDFALLACEDLKSAPPTARQESNLMAFWVLDVS